MQYSDDNFCSVRVANRFFMTISGVGGRGVFALALLVGVGWRFHPGVIRAGSARPGVGGVSSRDFTRFRSFF